MMINVDDVVGSLQTDETIFQIQKCLLEEDTEQALYLFSKWIDQEYTEEDLLSIAHAFNDFEDLVQFSEKSKRQYYTLSLKLFKKMYEWDPLQYGPYILYSCIELMEMYKADGNYEAGRQIGLEGFIVFLDLHIYNSLSAYLLSLLAEISSDRDGMIAYMQAIHVYETIEKNRNDWIVLEKNCYELAILLANNNMEEFAIQYFTKAKQLLETKIFTEYQQQYQEVCCWIHKISKEGVE